MAADPAPFDITTAAALDRVPHGFFGSSGGAHQFGYGGDGEAEHIRKTRAMAANAIVTDGHVVTPHQVHSPDVVTVTEAWEDSVAGRPVADALVTAQRGIVLGIVTADCAPVLFADAQAGIVGAAHAGWRGAHGGVIENTVAAMEALGANRANIACAIGPTIAQASYEVDEAFLAHFTDGDAVHFTPAPEREGKPRWQFDLPSYCIARLTASGVGIVENIARDTYGESARYYSYRRATQRNEANYGRQISMISVG
ncbi:peptidoglycan editing factor PgeF [Erythrobacter sp. F6033]|uniref:peptidoglycan editing factor PgeF n=1 Tax=Erythrobacter sp. F6033 TaxID=2926401 RepID=UPI001FF47EC5|nr:peptidoglycan editing factor PgeF [Erythrobacter sp. F6033]MCK0129861.1 peptidoglycan editing factor PgeF [Erythrobacter sp. F6033]